MGVKNYAVSAASGSSLERRIDFRAHQTNKWNKRNRTGTRKRGLALVVG